jgi:hypothetical protein
MPSHRTRLVSENEAVNAVFDRLGAPASDVNELSLHIGTAGSGDGTFTVYTMEFRYADSLWTAQVNAETGEVLNTEKH